MLQRPRLSRRDFPECHRLNYAIERELGAAPPRRWRPHSSGREYVEHRDQPA